ncbi:hypothetical protein Stok01_01881 [Sulfurisphaera tokodaii]
MSLHTILKFNEREPAMYGDEEIGATPEELYSKFEAESAIKMCESVL